VRSGWAIIGDVTQLNPNVMYEIGYAHGSGATPLLYARDAARLQDPPVHLKTLNIRLADETTPLEKLIDESLGSVRPSG
jgi:hypothetical protein